MPGRIEDYALIGDCESAALVGRDGSIDWLCWPRFDSDACFAALLGAKEHGRFRIAPQGETKNVTRRYRPDTLILETRFETPDGAVTLIDFMPIRGRNPDCVRIVQGERGRVTMCVELVLRFGYGAIVPWVRKLGDGTLRAIAGPDMVVLRTPVHLRGENLTTVGEFTVGEGDRVPFVLSYGPSHLRVPQAFTADAALQDTESYWTEWTRKGQVHGPWKDAVARSLITLKALTFGPTGGIVAAPTTSLPERIGGDRNWDYRFCWVRDATLTLLALMNAGYYEEAQCWRDWLTRAIAGRPEQLEVMYGVAGERRLTEWEVPWLPGYEESRPGARRQRGAPPAPARRVRRGDGHDASGAPRRVGGKRIRLGRPDRAARSSGKDLARAGSRHLGGAHRADALHPFQGDGLGLLRPRAEKRRDVRPARRRQALARTVRRDPRRCLPQWLGRGAQQFRARVRLAAISTPACCCSPRSVSSSRTIRASAATVEAIERDLVVDGLVLRYNSSKAKDGLPPGEGAFLACSFWLADAYCLLGRRDDAERLFRRLVGLCNDVGLLSEEYDPRAKRQLGNFPQAFSHVALINTAFNLTRAEKPAEQRSELPKGTAKAAEVTASA